MNTERLLREIDRRLAGLPPEARAEALFAVREELTRERRRLDPTLRIEIERERRQEAEALRDVLEAIGRQGSLSETIDEVLRQLARIVVFDSCSVALRDLEGRFRIIAGRGFADPPRIVGATFRDELSDQLSTSTAAISVADVREDRRFVPVEGAEEIRSWAGIPLVVEGDTIGLLCLDRHHVEPFGDDEIHRAKAVAFSAAAAIRKADLLEKVRRYATLMERVVLVDHAVFGGKPGAEVARLVLDGALRVGSYEGGLLVAEKARRLRVEAATDGLALRRGAATPARLAARATRRLTPEEAGELLTAGGDPLGAPLYLVPVATADRHLATLVLVDPAGDSPDDQLVEAYASRAAVALSHALRPRSS